ncbi:AAA family ATPase [Holdemanella biformis]|uniref:AAA family ATPase n=1 Tax=Holdemanella biformis TaxID=1735 RepID=UPI0022E84F33|nr:AAA family ATPase [Holdemanella biformis]
MDEISAKQYGYESNKEVKFRKYNGIYIKNFRSLKNCYIKLGSNLTVLSGKNGTMKSALLGLIAHPFNSPNDAKDLVGTPLKTTISNVFKMSKIFDNQKYEYYLDLVDIDGNPIHEYVSMYYVKNILTKEPERLRVVVGRKRGKGDGNFNLNTAYINFKRLFPIIDTDSVEKTENNMLQEDKDFIKNAYLKIFQKTDYDNATLVSDDMNKETFAPSNSNYNFEAISSGEDNLGHILLKMLAFKNYCQGRDSLQGVFCIDEVEASLHPIAQDNLIDFLLDFSKKYNIQIVVTTHSLSLINHVIEKQNLMNNGKDKICLNMISTRFTDNGAYNIITNPDYNQAYTELTLKGKSSSAREKIFVILEDDVEKQLFNLVIRKREAKKYMKRISNLTNFSKGNSFTFLSKLAKNAEELLKNAIIIFDADVKENLDNYRTSVYKMPSLYGLCLEAEIIKYIVELPGDANLFRECNKEKQSFINDFAQKDITNFEISFLERNSKRCKNWKDSDKNFLKYVRIYVKENRNIFDPFEKSIYKDINEKFHTKIIDTI